MRCVLLCALLLTLGLAGPGRTQEAATQGTAGQDTATQDTAAVAASDWQPPWEGPGAWPPVDEMVAVRALAQVEDATLLQEIGVVVDLWIRGDAPEGSGQGFLPGIPDNWIGSRAEPVTRTVDQGGQGGTLTRYRLVLQPAALGEVSIPPFALTWGGERTATTDEILVQVAGVLPEGAAVPDPERDAAAEQVPPAEGPQPEAPARPFAQPPDAAFWWWVFLAVAAGLAAGAAMWRLLSRRVRLHRQVDVPAHVQALRDIARLRTAPRDREEEIDAFYVAVSDVLRRYIEARFGLQAPERTTEEFLRELDAGGGIPRAFRRELAVFLEQCDLVKFARQVPGEEVHERTLTTAEGFVEATRPDRAGVAGGEAAA